MPQLARILPITVGLTMAICLAPWAAHPASAAYIDFLAGPLTSPAALTFGPDGSLSGSLPITALFGSATPLRAGQSVAIAGGLATFTFGTPAPDGMGGYLDKGGSITVTGAIAAQLGGTGSPETLFSMAFLPGELSSDQGGPDGWRTVAPFVGFATVSADVLALFGAVAGVGEVTVGFAGRPGGAVDVTAFGVRADVAGVPEPAAVGMVGVGLVMGWAGMRRRK